MRSVTLNTTSPRLLMKIKQPTKLRPRHRGLNLSRLRHLQRLRNRLNPLRPHAAGQPHRELKNAGHFVQEDAGPELAQIIVEWSATLDAG